MTLTPSMLEELHLHAKRIHSTFADTSVDASANVFRALNVLESGKGTEAQRFALRHAVLSNLTGIRMVEIGTNEIHATIAQMIVDDPPTDPAAHALSG